MEEIKERVKELEQMMEKVNWGQITGRSEHEQKVFGELFTAIRNFRKYIR